MHGWHLIPIVKDGKKALLTGWQDKATSNIEVQKAWEDFYPAHNLAVYCLKSGLVCLDVDTRNGGLEVWLALIAEHGEPTTRQHRTPTGGRHYFFKAKEGIIYKGQVQQGLDIKHNGYVLIPPSHIGGKPYKVFKEGEPEEMPEWLEKLCVKESVSAGPSRPNLKLSELQHVIQELRNHPLTYLEWVEIGMALHFIDSGEAGLRAYLDITNGMSFVQGDHEKAESKWRGFSNEKDNLITDQTLLYHASKKGIDISYLLINDFSTEMAEGYFIKHGGAYTCDSPSRIVEFFNDIGLRFYTKSDDTNIIQINREGGFAFRTKKGLDAVFAAYKYTYLDEKAKEKSKPALDVWFGSPERKEIKDIVFDNSPPREEILNTWKGFKIFKSNTEAPTKILTLINQYLCEEKETADWLLDYLAHTIQRPFEKTSLVPVHITGQGSGKGTLYDIIMGEILKNHYCTLNSSSDLLKSFNKFLMHKLLVLIDEANWSASKEQDAIMKKLTGSERITIEEKYKDSFETVNMARFVVASNEKNAVKIQEGDRRYYVIRSVALTDKIKIEIANLANEIRLDKKTEAERFFNFLSKRDIRRFNPYCLPMKAKDANHDIVMGNLSYTEEFIHHIVNNGVKFVNPWYGVSQKLINDIFLDWTKQMGIKAPSLIRFGREFRDFFNIKEENKKRVFGQGYFYDIKPFQIVDRIKTRFRIEDLSKDDICQEIVVDKDSF